MAPQLFAGTTNPLSWMHHASGIAKLVQARGHGSFETPIEKALLRSARPLLVGSIFPVLILALRFQGYVDAMYVGQITKCIFTGEDCFLNRTKWRKVSSNLTGEETGAGDFGSLVPTRMSTYRWNEYHDAYFVMLARVPGVVAAGYNMRDWRNSGIQPSPAQASQLEEEASALRTEFLAWYENAVKDGAMAFPVEGPSKDPTSPFTTVLQFANPWIGSTCVHFWATLLVLQECLDQCQNDVGKRIYARENRRLSGLILRSLDSVGRGLMGPYRVAYSIRIAFDFTDLPQRQWLLSVIRKHNQRFASVSSDVYPDNPAHLGNEEEATERKAGRKSLEANTSSWLS